MSRLGIDRAVVYALLLRAWQLLAGVASVLLIAAYFSREIQGYYYTFSGLLALQTFFELGLYVVVTSAASHQWAHLQLDQAGRMAGDADALSRLVSLGRVMAVWYGVASLLFIVAVGIAGTVFFSLETTSTVSWLSPWWLVVLLNGMLLWALPFTALLEGCNQVATVNRFRLIQAVCTNAAVWLAILLHADLWTAVAASAMRLLCDLYLLGVRYRAFCGRFFQRPRGPTIDWLQDIWPMQWRLAAGGVFVYLEYALYTPVMFYFHGPVLAGQMGMTWTLIIAVQSAALSWVQTRAPLFGMLIARRDFHQLDRLYFRLAGISIAVLAAGCLAAWLVIWTLYRLDLQLAHRLLPPLPAGLFLLGIVLYQLPRCHDIYLRAHRREPLMAANIISSLSIGVLVCVLGRDYGATGAAAGYLAVVALFNLPYKSYRWLRCRAEWHGT
jgi:hypothetical protein